MLIDNYRKNYIYILPLVILLSLSSCAIASNPPATLNLYINASEGGDLSPRRVDKLTDYFNRLGCNISQIEYGEKSISETEADFFFSATELPQPVNYYKKLWLRTIDNQPLASSILVREATGIQSLSELADVRFAFLSPTSITGYFLPAKMFEQLKISHKKDKITYTQTNVGAISLLLHKDVFAVAIASPLASIWAKQNNLTIVKTSEPVAVGGVWVNHRLTERKLNSCKLAFMKISSPEVSKRMISVFPAWIESFSDKP